VLRPRRGPGCPPPLPEAQHPGDDADVQRRRGGAPSTASDPADDGTDEHAQGDAADPRGQRRRPAQKQVAKPRHVQRLSPGRRTRSVAAAQVRHAGAVGPVGDARSSPEPAQGRRRQQRQPGGEAERSPDHVQRHGRQPRRSRGPGHRRRHGEQPGDPAAAQEQVRQEEQPAEEDEEDDTEDGATCRSGSPKSGKGSGSIASSTPMSSGTAIGFRTRAPAATRTEGGAAVHLPSRRCTAGTYR
jgi:hypothetical protein